MSDAILQEVGQCEQPPDNAEKEYIQIEDDNDDFLVVVGTNEDDSDNQHLPPDRIEEDEIRLIGPSNTNNTSSLSNQIYKRLINTFPIIYWLPRCKLNQLLNDAVAGFTCSTLLVPQSMAYAVIAGLPPVFGLYASITPALIYFFMGRSAFQNLGMYSFYIFFTTQFRFQKM
jgi:hypothetical protein